MVAFRMSVNKSWCDRYYEVRQTLLRISALSLAFSLGPAVAECQRLAAARTGLELAADVV
jgi:hypothetical protein